MTIVRIHTDGACLGNPGPGGYGVVLCRDGNIHELTRGFRLTTNNRMEVTAAIAGLEELRSPCSVELFSDSRYLIDPINLQWLNMWQAKGWRKADGDDVVNRDLWERMLALLALHQVRFHVGESALG